MADLPPVDPDLLKPLVEKMRRCRIAAEEQLPPVQRQRYRLRQEGLTLRQIGERVGRSSTVVRLSILVAEEKLQHAMLGEPLRELLRGLGEDERRCAAWPAQRVREIAAKVVISCPACQALHTQDTFRWRRNQQDLGTNYQCRACFLWSVPRLWTFMRYLLETDELIA